MPRKSYQCSSAFEKSRVTPPLNDGLGFGEIESDRCGAHSGAPRPGLPSEQLVRN